MERLLGKVFDSVTDTGDEIHFSNNGVVEFKLLHFQDCCEHVYVESIVGDLKDLENTPILKSEESYESDPNACESGTWSFYKLATRKGYVDIRFYGSSNGYYGESACLYQVS